MAFSFNPGQSTPSSPQGSAGWGASGGVGGATPSSPDLPAVPNSPFLFMQQRGGEKTAMAYAQILLVVVFFLAVIASVTLFAYRTYLTSGIDAKKAKILEKETSLKEYPFVEMKKTSDRITMLGQLLKEYASVRSSFRLLEKVVEDKVLFKDFTLAREKTGNYSLKLTVATNDYKTLVQQLDALKLSEYAKIVPTQKVERIKELKLSKVGTINLEILSPAAIQGILPEDIIFESVVVDQTVIASTTNQIP